MSKLDVREMVLYKHGVGFFIREGTLQGETATLSFKQDEINDVLKSLVLFDRAGGQILGIHYQTPMDTTARLASSAIHLSNEASLRDLLRDLRGRQVTLTFNYMNSPETFTTSGRLIGLDQSRCVTPRDTVEAIEPTLVSLLETDSQQVQVYELSQLRAVKIHDALSARDLDYFLDTSISEDNRRTVTVHLSPGQHELVLSYVAPSPTWRVSYRIVAKSDESGGAGTALLQGWGLFDNRLEEDLENVRVTLVAGQPISFIYDLYASRIPQRRMVQDETRVAPGPVQYQGTATATPSRPTAGGSLLRRIASTAPSESIAAESGLRPRVAPTAATADLKTRIQSKLLAEMDPAMNPNDPRVRETIKELYETILADEAVVLGKADRTRLFETIFAETLGGTGMTEPLGGRADISADILSIAQPSVAQGIETGEFFQYIVATPVSVKRGESALVPIIGADVQYGRELLYNGAKLPNHPVAALRFQNTTGLTLERGPVTIVQDSDYKGEAVMPFTRDGNEVYLPYAVELGLRIVERPHQRTETTGLKIENGFLIYEEYFVYEVGYALENTTSRPLMVTIEAPIITGRELHDTLAADIETLNERRWRVHVPAHTKTEFICKERQRSRRREELRRLGYDHLQKFLANRWLDQATFDRLIEMLDTLEALQRAKAERGKLTSERNEIYKQQEQLRANLQTLQSVGQEAALRNRMLGQLEATQNRLEEIENRLHDLTRQESDAESRIQEIIDGLNPAI